MFSKSFSCRLKNAFFMEMKLFSSAIYLNISTVSKENGIEASIITVNKTLKRKIINTFPEELLFYPNGKYLIVQSSSINPSHFIVGVLRGKGLKVSYARKLLFGLSQSLRCNECIFSFEEKISFLSLDIYVFRLL